MTDKPSLRDEPSPTNPWRLRPRDQGVFETTRLEIFVDAVLAIALTVLVLNLSIGEHLGKGGLEHEILRQKYTIAGIGLGFLWITGVWLLNLQIFRILRGVDHYAVLLTVAWALTITLMPFATLVLARGLNRPDLWVGVMAVGGVSLLATLISWALVHYAFRHGLMVDEVAHDPMSARMLERGWGLATLLLVVVIAVARFVPWLAFALLLVNWINVLLPSGLGARGHPGDLGRGQG